MPVLSTTASEGLRLASLLGYVAFFCLAAAVLLGMARAVDATGSRLGGPALEQLHLALAVAGLSGLVGHIAAHAMRERGGVAVWEAFVPFATGGWIVATGVAGWLLLIAVTIAVPWRQVLGYRGWLTIHRMAYLASALVAVHVIAASDEVARLELSGVAVLLAVAWIIVAGRRRVRGSDDFDHRRDHRRQEAGR